MKESARRFFLRKAKTPRLHNQKIVEWLKAYIDVERTLKLLSQSYTHAGGLEARLRSINVRKLLDQLSLSKRRLERKIGNTILLERNHLRKRIRRFTSSIRNQ